MYTSRSNPYNPYELPSQPKYGENSSKLQVPSQQSPFQQASSPRNNVDSYYFATQPPRNKKEYGLFSKRYLPKESAGNVSRSRVTQQNASMSGMGSAFPEEKLYSEEMLFLLSEEENNISYFK
jgi:hypothetical protein